MTQVKLSRTILLPKQIRPTASVQCLTLMFDFEQLFACSVL